jgi:uncharacterized protein
MGAVFPVALFAFNRLLKEGLFMSLQEQLTEALKLAMKAKQVVRLSTIRGIKTAVKNKEIELGHPLADQEVIVVISTLVKQRKESAEVYRANDRPELAAKEEEELLVLQEFLPAQLDEAELVAMIDAVISESAAEGMKDMGRVMKTLTEKTTGRADGKLVSQLVRTRLAG